MSKVSVIIPIYNIEKYVEQCIRSVMNQTLQDIEIICVDDGSTDKSGEICDELCREDSRIKVIHKKNRGLVSARKAGLAYATSEYVGFVDGDDWVEEEFYHELHNAMIENEVSMVESGIIDDTALTMRTREMKCKENTYKEKVFVKEIAPYLIYDGSFYSFGIITPNIWNKLFVTSCIKQIYDHIDDECSMAEDFASVYSYLMVYQSVTVLNRAYYHYRANPVSVKRKKYDNMIDILLKHKKNLFYYINKLKYNNNYKEQLNYFWLYSLFMSRMDLFDLPDEKIVPYGGIRKEQKIILYGAGVMGIYLYRYLVEEHGFQYVTWVDRDYKVLSQYYPVVSPETIEPNGDELIVVSAMKTSAVQGIKEDLMKKGISDKRIRWIKDQYIERPEKYLPLQLR